MSESVLITGEPGVQKMLDAYAPGPRQNLERRAVRAGAKPVQAELKSIEAGRSPKSFSKVPAAKVSTHGDAGMEVFAVVRPKSPLFNILEPGAKAHTIAPKGAAALAGQAGGSDWPARHSDAGRKRGADFFARGPVRHPGLRGRGDLPRAAATAGSAALAAMAAVVSGAYNAGGDA